MAESSELAVGEKWAYRASSKDEPTEAEVLALVAGRPARVKIKYLSGPLSGSEAEVPPSRLKAPWSGYADFLEVEAQWRALSSRPENIESAAVEAIFREFVGPSAEINHLKSQLGTVSIRDIDLADVLIGGGLHEMVAGSESIVDRAGAHYGWSIALAMAQSLCAFQPQRVMAYVHSEEAREQALLSVGEPRPISGTHSSLALLSEAAFYGEFYRPFFDLLRRWCGEDSADIQDELLQLRKEAARFAELFASAVALLADAGDTAASWGIYRLAYPNVQEKSWRAAVQLHAEHRRQWRAALDSADPSLD